MSNQKVYGPWIKWHGGKCPVPHDTLVEVRFRDGDCGVGYNANGYSWRHYEDDADIVEYRIVTEQTDLDYAR